MNASPLVFQAQRNNNTLLLSASAVANSQAGPANGQDFAGALNDAHAEPAHRNITKDQRRAEPSGGHLPQSGNPTPPAAPTSPTSPSASAPARQNSNNPAPGAAAAAPGAVGPAAATRAASGTPAVANAAPAPAAASAPAVVAANAAPALAASTGGTDTQVIPTGGPALLSTGVLSIPNAASTALPGAAVSAPPGATDAPAATHAPAASVASAAGVPSALAAPAAGADEHATPQTGTGNALEGATTASASTTGTASVSNDPALNGAAAAPAIDTAAQAVMAAALAQDSSSPQTNSASADLMVTDLGTALARSAASAPGRAPSPVLAVGTATVAAVIAASIAQVVSAAGSAAGADKHSRDNGSDSFLPGASSDGTVAAQQLSSANSTVTDSSPAPTFKVSAGVDSSEFGQGVADRVSVMMDGNLNSAKLQVNPPALGPIEVRIALQAGHAQVWFTSHSAVTRDALESSAPRLREMLGAQGFGQVSVDISQRSFQDRSPQQRGYEGAPGMPSDSIASVDPGSALARTASGLLDAYA